MIQIIRLVALSMILTGVVATTTSARAEEFNPKVTITSFVRVGDVNSRLGEVCGVVTDNDNSPINLNVTADPNTLNPGAYHTFTGTNGRYCMLIHTVAGTVEVSMVGGVARPAARAQVTE